MNLISAHESRQRTVKNIEIKHKEEIEAIIKIINDAVNACEFDCKINGKLNVQIKDYLELCGFSIIYNQTHNYTRIYW